MVVNIWNSRPNWVVFANTTNMFKTRLDKLWHNQDITYFQGTVAGNPKRDVKTCHTKNLSKE